MDVLEKRISTLVENQFPAVFRDDGPLFVQFVRKYYEWMEEQGQAIYHTRRMFEYKDIDETTDEFVQYFKKQYLNNVQLDTVESTRTLIKNSLDLYRSKGTERGLKLLFQAAFGVLPDVFYPGDYLFKTSDGVYKQPQYIELSPHHDNKFFHNKQIIGVESTATAYVENVIRVRVGIRYVDLLYLSSVIGTFETGEQLTTYLEDNVIGHKPYIVGSVTELQVSTAGEASEYEIGDRVEFTDGKAVGKAIVTGTTQQTGTVQFILQDGGYGFSANADLYISETLLTLANNTLQPVFLENAQQKLGLLKFVNSTGAFANGEQLYSYHANGSVKGQATILSIDLMSANSGFLQCYVATGNIEANAIYTTANAVSANLDVLAGYTDQTAVGKVIGFANTKLGLINTANKFLVNLPVTLSDSNVAINVTRVSDADGASFEVSSALNYPETVNINTDQIAPYANTLLNNVYLFPAMASANINTVIEDALTNVNKQFGSISSLVNYQPGSNYQEPPMIVLYEKLVRGYDHRDLQADVVVANGSFNVGDLVYQATTDFRGQIRSVNSTSMMIRNLRVLPQNQLEVGLIHNENNTAFANVQSYTDDLSYRQLGFNANVYSKLATANGSVTGLKLVDSGIGFERDVTLTFSADGKTAGVVVPVFGAVGKAEGYYTTRGSEPSGNHRIFDGYYWQEFSYDVISSVRLDKYSKLLKDVVHSAGWIFFGSFRHQARSSLTLKQNSVPSRVAISS